MFEDNPIQRPKVHAFRSLLSATAEEVFAALANHVTSGPRETLPASDGLGCTLAADVRAGFDYPPFDRAVMDGYAVRSADFAGGDGRLELRVRGLARAGLPVREPVEPGTCVQINTGAIVPPGADSIVIVENSRAVTDECVQLKDHPAPGQHIERRGGLRRAGELIVRAGSRIGPGALAAIISAGVDRVEVFRRPRVNLLSTGDELAAAGENRGATQIYDSNSVMLAEYVRQSGARVSSTSRCPDDTDRLTSVLRSGLAADVLCVTGGMSKGSHDLVPGLLEELGVEWLVQSLNLKPGKPTRIGRAPNGCWVLGLPGNPVSCAVCFLLFGRALLGGLQGLPVREPAFVAGELESCMPANGARPMFQPGEWHARPDGGAAVLPIDWRGSGDPFGMAAANALVYRPARAAVADRGESVRFVPIDVPA